MNMSKNPKQGDTRERTPEHEPTTLDDRYGEIGISAVAAALPYTGDKSTGRTDASVRIDQRFIEVAA
jgi:hypothetical protein